MPKLKSTAIAALAFALLAVFAGPAAARDRNRDRIPDRWEKRHHLSLRVNQARRDQDGDGLRNRAEFRARTDPRDKDSDDDGVNDRDEHAGTIASFDSATRTLTISLFAGGSISGVVVDATEIECEGATTSSSGDDRGDDDHGDDDRSGPGSGDDDDPGDDAQGDDDERSCGTSALTAGRRVEEAELRLRNGRATFEEIELAP